MSITIQKEGKRCYAVGDTYAVKDRIKSIGGHWDADRRAWWVGSGKEVDLQRIIDSVTVVAASGERPKENPDSVRLTGKGTYKGRTYYLGSRTRDGSKVRCLTLPDSSGNYLDFWASIAEVQVIKTYTPREMRYGRHTRVEHVTLGGIASFVAREKKNRAEGGQVCAECGKSGELVADLEDGLLKHRRCCDIEP